MWCEVGVCVCDVFGVVWWCCWLYCCVGIWWVGCYWYDFVVGWIVGLFEDLFVDECEFVGWNVFVDLLWWFGDVVVCGILIVNWLNKVCVESEVVMFCFLYNWMG